MELKYLPIPIENRSGDEDPEAVPFLSTISYFDLVSSGLRPEEYLSLKGIRGHILHIQRVFRKRIRDSGSPMNEFKLVIIDPLTATEDNPNYRILITSKISLRRIDE
jgi:hypothetical protein